MYKLIVSALVLSGCAAELHTVRHIPRLMETFEVDGLAVAAVSGDRVLISRGFGVTVNGTEYTATTPCGLFSATKVLASLTYARLAQEGRIDLDAPLRVYLPDAPDAWAEIPFYRLLNHTSGISMVVNTPEFGALAANPQATNEDLYRLVRDAPLDYAPGAYSRYRQSGYAIGELILSGTLGVPFDVLVERYVTKPAGMRHTAHPATTDTTQAPLILSAGGYETTAEDMARLFSGMYHGTVIDAGHWKDVLLTNTYLFGDYSLGSIREIRGGVLTLGHRGGGARANVRYAPDHHVGVMVCTDDTDNNELAITLARMLIDEISSGQAPRMPLLVALSGYRNGEDVVSAYREAEKDDRYDLSESESLLNDIGYGFLSREQTDDAVTVFSLNTELFPNSANTHDSLGEALLARGDRSAALAEYKKAIALDPNSANARAMVEKLQAL